MIKWLKKRKIRSKKNFDLHKRGEATFVKNIPKCGRWHTYCIDKAVMAV